MTTKFFTLAILTIFLSSATVNAAAPPEKTVAATKAPSSTSNAPSVSSQLARKGMMLIRENGPTATLEKELKEDDTRPVSYLLLTHPVIVSVSGSQTQPAKGILFICLKNLQADTSTIDLEDAQKLSKVLVEFTQLIPKWKEQAGQSEKEAIFATSDSFELRMKITGKGQLEASVSIGQKSVIYPLTSEIDFIKLKQAVDSGIEWIEKH